MPQYMLNSISAIEWPEGMEITPEMIQAVIQKYNNWAKKLEDSGRLVSLNKLKDEYGRTINGFGGGQTVTDGPYSETKEVIGGYWIITAANYDEAVEWARDCPTLEYGGRIEVREIEDLSTLQ
jgi:hypothetical protein